MQSKQITDILYEYNASADITLEDLADILSDTIVRCKDCRNRKTPDCPMYEIIRQEDGWMETVHYRKIDHTADEDFCSKGVPVHE